ncbi:MAG TPA: TolC family outer membrane protein [Ramlibacter sp.]|nr:TolC family outer membrane protein [Ramlibacter sp.]
MRRFRSFVVAVLAVCGAAIAQQPPANGNGNGTGPRLTLAQAYQLALRNDATLRAATATADSARERLPQARSQLLPNVRASLAWYRNDLQATQPGPLGRPLSTENEYSSSSRAVQLRQPLIRPYQWADLRQARAQVEASDATLQGEVQNLAVRVTTAYVQQLATSDDLALALAQKRAYTALVQAATRKMDAGSGTRTDIDEAQAKLDLAVARELQARQNLNYTRQALQLLTGPFEGELARLDPDRLPLAPPEPVDVQSWIARAEQASPEIRTLVAQREAARQEIDKQEAGYLPTLDLVARKTISNADNVTRIDTRFNQTTVGVELNVPLYTGGYASSRVRQARAELVRAEEQLEAARRELGLRVHKEFRGASEGVLLVQAMEQAVKSAQTSVQSTRRSWEAGARTQVDLLRAEEERVSALRDLGAARYTYLLSRVTLRSLVADADQAAMDEVNGWLQR